VNLAAIRSDLVRIRVLAGSEMGSLGGFCRGILGADSGVSCRRI
jgi:hypothetical protein